MDIIAVYYDKDITDPKSIRIVLTRGIVGDYAAYEGPATWPNEVVASRGNKRHDEDNMRAMFFLHIKPEDKYRH